jgi:predicted peptidase
MKYILVCLLFAVSCKQDFSLPKQSNTVSPAETAKAVQGQVPGAPLVGNQYEISVPTASWGNPTNALLYLPEVYSKDSNTRFPLIIELPGIGQQSSNINDMLTTGLCQRISNGLKPSAVNPVDGKTYRFIVFSPQGPAGSWGWQESQIMGAMLPALLKTYRIDTTRIYVSGFSAGGWGAVTFMDDDTNAVKKIAAINPIAPASLDNEPNIKWAAKYGLATWNIVGGADAFLGNSQTITNDINNNQPIIPALLTVIPNEGHSSWDQAYDPTWYDPADPKKLNLYQWFLQYKRTFTSGKSK